MAYALQTLPWSKLTNGVKELLEKKKRRATLLTVEFCYGNLVA